MRYGFDYITSGSFAGDWQELVFLEDTTATLTTTTGDTVTDVSFSAGQTIVGPYEEISVTSGGLLAYKRRNVTKRSLFTGLLDTYSGAAAAYSLRKLRTAYSGSAIRVRRSSDNTEQDIGFTASGDLDQSALTTFTGANDGFVVTWYDQSGNTRNATQAMAASQPRIVNAGTVDTLGGKPIIEFDGTDDLLATSNFNVASPSQIFIASQSVTFIDDYYFDGKSANNRFGLYSTLANTAYQVFTTANAGAVNTINSTSKITAGNANLISILKNGASSAIYENGASIGTGTLTTDDFIGLTIGARFNGTQSCADGMREVILYPSDQSANRTAIESNINSYYSIY